MKKQRDPFGEKVDEKVKVPRNLEYGEGGEQGLRIRQRKVLEQHYRTEEEFKKAKEVQNCLSKVRWMGRKEGESRYKCRSGTW